MAYKIKNKISKKVSTHYTQPFQLKKFAEGQAYPYVIDTSTGKKVKRIKYGQESEDWGANKQPCHDCGVTKGFYHWLGCDVERSPIKSEKGRQLLTSDKAGDFSK